MHDIDTRWHQRLDNYHRALEQLSEGVQLTTVRSLTNLEKQGLVKAFEFTHELAWNVMKDYADFQGGTGITGSRDATRDAFQRGLMASGDIWMEMIKSRKQSSHTYNKSVADEILKNVVASYFLEFQNFAAKMRELRLRT